MPIRVIRIERTPNPNARKFVTDPDSPMPIRSFFRAEQAREDELGAALFAIEGVTNVLIHTHFVSINIVPSARWGAIERDVKRVLADV